MSSFPFTAVVGSDDLALALLLTSVAPEVGGVLVRGEKGTAKSTMVRALVEVLPEQPVITECRFGCHPDHPDATCPDGPHDGDPTWALRSGRLVELPVGASEDRVVGSLDLGKALGDGVATFAPGLLAEAHRGILYVDEVNLLHDHLVDLLLDAAAMGRSSVERDGVSFSHDARFVLVGTMNPEEGELRPQLLDRFGLTVEVAASRVPTERAEIVRRRIAYDADPAGFAARFADEQAELAERLASARALLPTVRLTDTELVRIARVCAGFGVDGMRADIVTARAARAHAAWQGRDEVTIHDVRAAARLALPHRRRRKPFDAPGLDHDLLEQLLADDPDPDPDPEGDPTTDDATSDGPTSDDVTPGDAANHNAPDSAQSESGPTSPTRPDSHADSTQARHQDADGTQSQGHPQDQSGNDNRTPPLVLAPQGVSAADDPFRAISLRARGVGRGAPGRRSRAITTTGRRVGALRPKPDEPIRLHLPATIRAAAARAATTNSPTAQDAGLAPAPRPLRVRSADLRTSILEGPEANLVLFCVDASGSMAARARMTAVKTAVLSLLVDAYQRRDRVGVVTFRGDRADVALPPTSSVDAAAACLADLPHGGRTPLAEGLVRTLDLLAVEHVRDPHQRALVLVLTDGRATAGPDALHRAMLVADHWSHHDTIVIDCETGRFRMGLARTLAGRMSAQTLTLDQLDADALLRTVHAARDLAKVA